MDAQLRESLRDFLVRNDGDEAARLRKPNARELKCISGDHGDSMNSGCARTFTRPSTFANRVWSLPMPMPSPFGWNSVPLWRRMMLPLMTTSPWPFLIPRYFGLDLRLLLETPAAFLVAQRFRMRLKGVK